MSEETTVTTEAQGNTEAPAESGTTPEPSQAPQTPNREPAREPYEAAQAATQGRETDLPDPGPLGAEGAEPPETPLERVPGSPEGYRVNLPEGVEADPVMVEGLKRFAHRNGWTQGQVDGLAEFWSGYAEFQKRQHGKQLKSWDTEIRADWGRDYSANRRTALRGLNVAGERIGAELNDILNRSGMTNHPAVNRFLYAVGALMSEDTFVRGAPSPVTVPRDEDGRPILKFKNM